MTSDKLSHIKIGWIWDIVGTHTLLERACFSSCEDGMESFFFGGRRCLDSRVLSRHSISQRSI